MIDMKLKPEAKTMLGEPVEADTPEYPMACASTWTTRA